MRPLGNHSAQVLPETCNQHTVLAGDSYPHTSCVSCGASYDGNGDENWQRYRLCDHGKILGHARFPCSILGCDKIFIDHRERDAHHQRPHAPGHGRTSTPTPFDCIQCGSTLFSKAILQHAKEQQHQHYACDCGASFSQLDVLNRHLEKVSDDDTKYPFLYCRLHRGPDSFRRHDHLIQHMRNHHHHDMESKNALKFSFPVCSFSECPHFRDEPSQSAYTKHMREVHNECPFPCDIQGCSRVGRKGYFREKDLMKYRRDEHTGCDEYQVTPRDTRTTCVDCGISLDFSSVATHLEIWCPKRSKECSVKNT